jgi:hypothetical protein
MCFRANMRNGRINEPAPLQQQIAVVSCPRSALAIIPICFYTVGERRFGGPFVEVCKPVLTMLQRHEASISCSYISSDRRV